MRVKRLEYIEVMGHWSRDDDFLTRSEIRDVEERDRRGYERLPQTAQELAWAAEGDCALRLFWQDDELKAT